MANTLLDCQVLYENLDNPSWVIVDCRFDLAQPDAGRRAYEVAHIPGAVYAHVEDDLSGPPVTDRGRHPLPQPAALSRLFGRLGIGDESQVVAYDDANGAFAARLWWLLRFMGHDRVAVLDGGWTAWLAAGYPAREGVETRGPALFRGVPRWELVVTADQVSDLAILVDSRAPERYRGEVEPIDRRAGHIPGARNYFYERNWDDKQRYLPAAELRQRFLSLLGRVSPHEAAFYCGSGVTACANLLAMAHAGLGDGRLYAGSWSDWITDPGRPVVEGP